MTSAGRLVDEPKHRPSNKLAVIVDAARDQTRDLNGEIASEPVSFFLIERICLTANNGPGSLEDGHERNIVKFSLPSLSSHVGPRDCPFHSVNAEHAIQLQLSVRSMSSMARRRSSWESVTPFSASVMMHFGPPKNKCG